MEPPATAGKTPRIRIYHVIADPLPARRAGYSLQSSPEVGWDRLPARFKGQADPLMARIIAVVGVWDAITGDRPYRSAWSREKAADYIRATTGSHFDPQVIEKFMDMLGEEN